jgi:rifampicin phosphotransferase
VGALLELTEIGGDAGGKAAGLAKLLRLGLPVPRALVLGPDAYDHWRRNGSIAPADVTALEAALDSIGTPIAVRSSAADEDAGDRSAAGQYESVMGARTLEDVVRAVEQCYRAAESERATAYRGGGDAQLALVVQHEVPAQRAGVAFSVDPVTGDPDTIVVEAAFGHGERIVSGVVEPDRYRVSRATGAVRARVAEKVDVAAARRYARALRDDEVAQVVELVLRAEEGFGGPVDVEFCFDGVTLWLVQCRPITTLA